MAFSSKERATALLSHGKGGCASGKIKRPLYSLGFKVIISDFPTVAEQGIGPVNHKRRWENVAGETILAIFSAPDRHQILDTYRIERLDWPILDHRSEIGLNFRFCNFEPSKTAESEPFSNCVEKKLQNNITNNQRLTSIHRMIFKKHGEKRLTRVGRPV